MEIIVLGVLLTAFNLLGLRWGADSRDGRDWQPLQLAGNRDRHCGA